ncbi:adenine phosphoribosyltransferase [Condylostylus longicornis]|uniref:adenine phosphoribosyltransferase n=1 Tax=Condylostylus longicornis TaxID=2530218 RepID=UPI00244DFB42|nr:adenine phosphoribosyltransferase [Condylostylus longicornis]
MDNNQKLEIIKKHIGIYPDFPKKGIIFRDIFTAITNGEVCSYLKDLILDHIKNVCPDIDVVVGLDARGFLFSFMIAAELKISCVPVRKKGKLPGECERFEYILEYGSDVFEIQKTAIKPGQKVLIIDDLLATGGSINAAIELVKKCGGTVKSIFVILELTSLNGREKLQGCDFHSLIKYND